MVTASHLPRDRNGFKLFSADAPSGFSKAQIQSLGALAESLVQDWFSHCDTYAMATVGNLPSALRSSDDFSTTRHVDWMPVYANSLKEAILQKTSKPASASSSTTSVDKRRPLQGLKVILNPGNGAGGFFQEVLNEMGADVSASMHIDPDGDFPNGIPNPEDLTMLQQTIAACQTAQADLGIMLDTDADRCGFVVPRISTASAGQANSSVSYEPLNRNRLIALLGVVFAREKPGCAVVTDSVTSEGLSAFLQEKLGLKHERFIKGYANVIDRARELTESGVMNAELAIETSGHCAMRENGYLDDGTYTAVQVVSLLARERAAANVDSASGLLDLISDLEELDEVSELRMSAKDGSLETMRHTFDHCVLQIEECCRSSEHITTNDWRLDTDNLEGIRVRLDHGQFFMLRKSLHDPIISLQIEARSKDEARKRMVQPILNQFLQSPANSVSIDTAIDLSVLRKY
jgi:phosphomannomutase